MINICRSYDEHMENENENEDVNKKQCMYAFEYVQLTVQNQLFICKCPVF
jgi:hypothetical protein